MQEARTPNMSLTRKKHAKSTQELLNTMNHKSTQDVLKTKYEQTYPRFDESVRAQREEMLHHYKHIRREHWHDVINTIKHEKELSRKLKLKAARDREQEHFQRFHRQCQCTPKHRTEESSEDEDVRSEESEGERSSIPKDKEKEEVVDHEEQRLQRKKHNEQRHLMNVRRKLWLADRERTVRMETIQRIKYMSWLESIIMGSEETTLVNVDAKKIMDTRLREAEKKKKFVQLSGGVIASREPDSVLKNQLLNMSNKDMEVIFNSFDTDGSGTIDEVEFDGVVKMVVGTVFDGIRKHEMDKLAVAVPYASEEELEMMYWDNYGQKEQEGHKKMCEAVRIEFRKLMIPPANCISKDIFLSSWRRFFLRTLPNPKGLRDQSHLE